MGELRCTFCGNLFPCGCRAGLCHHCENCDKQAAEIERLREGDKHTVAIGELESWKLSQAGLQKENDKLREENKRLREAMFHPGGACRVCTGTYVHGGRCWVGTALNQTDPGNSAG